MGQHLIGIEHAGRVEIALSDHQRLAGAHRLDPLAAPDRHGQPDDGIVGGLPVHLGQHCIGLGFGEESTA